MFHRLHSCWFFCALFVVLAGPARPAGAASRPWVGVVAYVVDGDTLAVRPARGGAEQRVRLEGLDAPEICQSWGVQARQALSSRVLHHTVQVRPRARDDYGRLVARIEVEQGDVGAWLVAHGHAWSDAWRGRRGRYGAEEAAARRDRRGLFSQTHPERPVDFRHRHGPCRSAS